MKRGISWAFSTATRICILALSIGVLALWIGSSLSAQQRILVGAWNFRAEFGGMMALIPEPSEGGARMIVVNSLEPIETKYGMAHIPILEINCDELAKSKYEEKCKQGAVPFDSSSRGGRGVIKLDDGFDIALESAQGVAVARQGFDYSDVVPYMFDLSKPGLDFKPNSLLVKPALAGNAADLKKLAVARIEMRSGRLVHWLVEPRQDWSLEEMGTGNVKQEKRIVLATAQWVVPFIDQEQVVLRIAGYGVDLSSRDVMRLALRPAAGTHNVSVGFWNEPSTSDFCKHEPNASDPYFHHFGDYFVLSDPARQDSPPVLLRYEGSDEFCVARTRPPKICMMPIL